MGCSNYTWHGGRGGGILESGSGSANGTACNGENVGALIEHFDGVWLGHPKGVCPALCRLAARGLRMEGSHCTEGYRLSVLPNRVQITASTQKGLFYGFQTLRQLMPPAAFGSTSTKAGPWEIPQVQIDDAPRYAWRGILVDVSRRFQTPETIKKLIDAMAACKLNTLHWHLTRRPRQLYVSQDLPGIRCQRLQEIGAPNGSFAGMPVDSESPNP